MFYMLSSPQFVAMIALAGLLAQSPDELLRRSDVGAFAPASFRARLTLKRLPQPSNHELEVWRSDESKILIRFLDPKERGKYLLRIQGQLWFLAPGAKEPLRVNPSYRLYGGATLDEILGARLAQEYRVESASEQSDSEGTLVALELRAKSEGRLFPEIRYVVRSANQRPVNALYRLRSGREATSVAFIRWHEGKPLYASQVVVKDLLRKGESTEVNILEMEERQVPEALFDLRDATARRALEATMTPMRP